MKNKDILLDVIGDTNERLVPELTENKKRNSIFKWTVLGGVCAAVLIAFFAILPKTGDDTVISPSDNVSNNAMLLAAAVYPEMVNYPDETAYSDWKEFDSAYKKWVNSVGNMRNQPSDYKDGFDTFFANSINVFLEDNEKENKVYSPLGLYMALGMSAEMTGGNSRQQILDALAQPDMDTLRSHAKSIWQANYVDDGIAKCVLATSLWTNNKINYDTNTIESLASNYYSSVYCGDPNTEDYNNMLRNWLNEQTDDLLADYVSDIEMDPRTVLTLASTVNYNGKWDWQFVKDETKQGTFHAPDYDIECDFMNSFRDCYYCWGDKFGSISMKLENNGQMKIILPDKDVSPQELLNDTEMIGYLNTSNIYGYKNNKYVNVTLSVPKFDISSHIDLKDGLNEMGITDLFDSTISDFSPLTSDIDEIYVNKAEQDTRVMIDEEGCKASSLTIMIAEGGAMPPDDHIDFIIDRPFIFEIMSETGLPLFVGIVNNPVQ